MRLVPLPVGVLFVASICWVGASPAAAETVKARVLEVKPGSREARVDVAGQTRVYRVNDPSLFGVLKRGRLVVITAEMVAGRHTIVRAEAAAQEGSVLQVDVRRGSVSIRDADTGASRIYYFDSHVDRSMRVGDRIRFDVEERGGGNVITRWTRLGGGGVFPPTPSLELVLYENMRFGGRPFPVTGAMSTLPGFNNRAESLRVNGGLWELCERPGFRGRCVTVSGNVGDLGALGLRNKVASVRPLRQPR